MSCADSVDELNFRPGDVQQKTDTSNGSKLLYSFAACVWKMPQTSYCSQNLRYISYDAKSAISEIMPSCSYNNYTCNLSK